MLTHMNLHPIQAMCRNVRLKGICMPSLLELVERVNKGEIIDPQLLEIYQDSTNAAEKFLASHARAMLDLRRSQSHLLHALEAIEYGDQKVLNQYTSVLGFLGESADRTGPVVRFGAAAIARREISLGLEAIQSSILSDIQTGGQFISDRDNTTLISEQYARAAQNSNWFPTGTLDYNNPQPKVAYITSTLADDDAISRTIAGLSRHLPENTCKFSVYSTEAFVRREKWSFAGTSFVPSSTKRAKETLEKLTSKATSVYLTPTDGDLLTASKELANQLIKDQIDLVFIDATFADPIASLLSHWQIARTKIVICRRYPMYGTQFDAAVYLDQQRFDLDKDFWKKNNIDPTFIFEGIELTEHTSPAPQRSAYGIPDQSVILATAGNELDETMGEEFVDTMISILRSNPLAVYLVVGDGEFASQKRRFEAAGVSKRVGYTGKRKDFADFLRIADIYVAQFPSTSLSGILAAMSVAKPVVGMQWNDPVSRWIGSDNTVQARDTSAYIERTTALINSAEEREILGQTLRQDVEQRFNFTHTASALAGVISRFGKPATENLAQAA